MKSNYKLMLTAVGAFALGAVAVQGLHAQMKPPVLVVGEVAVKDEAGYKSEWLPKIQPIIKESAANILQVASIRLGRKWEMIHRTAL